MEETRCRRSCFRNQRAPAISATLRSGLAREKGVTMTPDVLVTGLEASQDPPNPPDGAMAHHAAGWPAFPADAVIVATGGLSCRPPGATAWA